MKELDAEQAKAAEKVAINLLHRAPLGMVITSTPRGVQATDASASKAEGQLLVLPRPAFQTAHNWWGKGYRFADPNHRRLVAAAFRAILEQIEAEWGPIPDDLGHWS